MKRSKITRLHMRAANARTDFLHKVSTDLAKTHSVIEIENSQIQNMTRSAKGAVDRPSTNVKAKSRLNRSILDQGWGMFATMLNYKLAERRVKFLPFEYGNAHAASASRLAPSSVALSP